MRGVKATWKAKATVTDMRGHIQGYGCTPADDSDDGQERHGGQPTQQLRVEAVQHARPRHELEP